jgi:hypothetical protein
VQSKLVNRTPSFRSVDGDKTNANANPAPHPEIFELTDSNLHDIDSDTSSGTPVMIVSMRRNFSLINIIVDEVEEEYPLTRSHGLDVVDPNLSVNPSDRKRDGIRVDETAKMTLIIKNHLTKIFYPTEREFRNRPASLHIPDEGICYSS